MRRVALGQLAPAESAGCGQVRGTRNNTFQAAYRKVFVIEIYALSELWNFASTVFVLYDLSESAGRGRCLSESAGRGGCLSESAGAGSARAASDWPRIEASSTSARCATGHSAVPAAASVEPICSAQPGLPDTTRSGLTSADRRRLALAELLRRSRLHQVVDAGRAAAGAGVGQFDELKFGDRLAAARVAGW